MDQQVLETIIHRLERIETLIDSRTSQTHDRYAEIKEELGIIKADVKEIKVEHVNVVKRVEKITGKEIKFYKVDKARTREYGGSGIGLSIVKAIMESMNRNYGVENYTNGVMFWFELETVKEQL